MVKGLTNARIFLEENSGGGDKVWVEKDFGVPEIAGDKVFIKKNHKGDFNRNSEYTDRIATAVYCDNDGSVTFHWQPTSSTSSSKHYFYRYHYNEGLYQSYINLGTTTVKRKYHRARKFGKHIVFSSATVMKSNIINDIIAGNTVITEIYGRVLKEGLILQYVSTGIYQLVRYDMENDAYGEVLGSIDVSSSFYMIDVFCDGDKLLITLNNGADDPTYKALLFDISDLYNPILLNEQVLKKIPRVYCATGLNVGDYVIMNEAQPCTYEANGIVIYQIKEGGVLGDAKDINSEIVELLSGVSTLFYNEENKVLSIGSNFFKYENGKFNRLNIPITWLEVNKSGTPDVFVVSENLEHAVRLFTSTESNTVWNYYYRSELGASWATCSSANLTSDVYSGIFTGNVDENDRIEVKALLPDKVNLTVTTDIDVNGNEIEFEGVAK